MDGKNSDASPRWICVVAGALRGDDGRWLMHRRPPGKHHAGLWEFPGGKVEGIETPVKALIRELHEELGIICDPQGIAAAGLADSTVREEAGDIVILLYTVSTWSGVPQALEGGETGWFTPEEIENLPKPPLDADLARQLFQKR